MNLIRAMSPRELAEVFFVVIESYDKNVADMPVIRAHAVDHIHKVYQVCRRCRRFFEGYFSQRFVGERLQIVIQPIILERMESGMK